MIDNLSKDILVTYEIIEYWMAEQGVRHFYIGRRLSGNYVTFSYDNGIEENNYAYFKSYRSAREYLKKKYCLYNKMKKVE